MNFKIIGKIEQERTFAESGKTREIARLRTIYGKGRWQKRKGIAQTQFKYRTIRTAEVHWYEATGIGRKEYKITYFVD